MLLTFYSILLLLFAMIPSGQSTAYKRHKYPFDIQTAAIFNVPKVAKELCPMGMKWYDGKCRISVDWSTSDGC